MDLKRLVLIVTGSHLKAEMCDRPLAYRLQSVLAERLGKRGRVQVCGDVWYMNSGPLRSCPTVSVGGPAVNALSAYLADKIPSAFVIEGRVLVQADPDFEEPVACCWGADEAGSAVAVDAFIERYADAFIESAAKSWE